MWKKEELSKEPTEPIVVPVYKRSYRTDCRNYTYNGISVLSNTYKVLSNIQASKLTPYAEEMLGDHQCGFRRNRSSTDNTFCFC